LAASRLFFALIGSAFGLLLGCTGPTPPNPSDPAVGRETLQKALEAWKRGDSHEAYQKSTPDVTVVERTWQKGSKLPDFEIAGDSAPAGYDVQFKVKLTVQDAAGKPTKQKAVYNVSTTPAIVVVRMEGGG
jgi:hypothetical protein